MADSVVVSALCLLLSGVLTFVGVGFLLLTLCIARAHWRYRHLPGPPRASFFFGHLGYYRKSKYVGNLLLQWSEEYYPVYKIFFMHKCLVWISASSAVKEVLTKSKYPKSSASYKTVQYMCGVRFLGLGLVTETDHNKWHRRRVVYNPAFNKKYLTMFMEQFNRVGDRWIETLMAVADGKTFISMHDYLCRITLDAIAEIGFNNTLNAVESGDNNRFLVAILTCLQSISHRVKDPLFQFRPSQSEFRQSVRQSIHFLRSHGQQLLDERRSLMNSGQPVPEDMLTYIMKYKDSDQSVTDDDLLDDFMTLFLAGQETTSNALSFLFLEIGRHADVLNRLQEEVDSVMGSRTYVEYEDISQLEYCGQVFKETLRMYPPGPATARTNLQDLYVEGHRIPSHSWIMFSFYAIHRMSRYYDSPEEFRPERFAPGAPRQLFTYMPFSLGQRSCIGQQFAQIEAKVLMCKFLKAFKFILDPNQSFEIVETATLRPAGGTMMSLAPRTVSD